MNADLSLSIGFNSVPVSHRWETSSRCQRTTSSHCWKPAGEVVWSDGLVVAMASPPASEHHHRVVQVVRACWPRPRPPVVSQGRGVVTRTHWVSPAWTPATSCLGEHTLEGGTLWTVPVTVVEGSDGCGSLICATHVRVTTRTNACISQRQWLCDGGT